jgi:hypothetical protein
MARDIHHLALKTGSFFPICFRFDTVRSAQIVQDSKIGFKSFHFFYPLVNAAATLAPSTLFGDNGTLSEVRIDARIRNYEVIKHIGEGGMGVVYRARHALETFSRYEANSGRPSLFLISLRCP